MITINEAEEILKKEYHRDNFLYLLNDVLLPDYGKDEREVRFSNTIFNKVVQLGMSKKCDVFIFEVILNESVQNRRVAITQEMFRILREQRINNALVAFSNSDMKNYRISLLTSKYESDGDKVRKVISNPRRYSYYLGYGTKTNTTYKYLIQKGKTNSIDELIRRFSVEIVNKQFYNEIALCFTELVGGKRDNKEYKPLLKIHGSNDHKEYSEFAVRLIGRIVFCWFLKEKKSKNNVSLIPDNFLSIQAIKENENYYQAVLEPLFFEILNTEQKNRKNKFGKDEIYRKIPYLNGGLFCPHGDDYYQYSSVTESGALGLIKIPDKWFESLFMIFEQYNFTVDENTTYDVELSIDPEMLGRIFENLLAEINPETGKSAKKMTGSFYTPREIVEYMVDSSLHEYLQNKTSIESDKLKKILSYGKNDEKDCLSEAEKKKIIDALYSLAILDPACGSGAFPMGMLQKIVYILQEIDPNAKLWFDKAIDNVLIRKEIEKKFSIGALDFIRKLSVIQKTIFGVDIQPIAVEIARLRCFLSLIIEEKVDDNEENRGINPLPNLDFKFVIANTLIKLERSIYEDESHINELKVIRDEYFNADNEKREELKLRFTEIQKKMIQATNEHNWKGNKSQYQSLSIWFPFENKPTEWFDPIWMFGIKNGFDIVIGNPPYFVLKKSEKLKSIYEKIYHYLKSGRVNIYQLFIGCSAHLLSKNGVMTFIHPKTLLSDAYLSATRNFLLSYFISFDIINIISRTDTFGAVLQSVVVSLWKKNQMSLECRVAEVFKKSDFINLSFLPLKKNDAVSPHKTLLVSGNPIVYKIEKKLRNIETIPLNFVTGNIEWNKYAPYLSGTIKTNSKRLIYGENIQRFHFAESRNRANTNFLSNKATNVPILDETAIFTQRTTAVEQPYRIISSIVNPKTFEIPIVSENHTNVFICKDIQIAYYILGILNSKLIDFYFRLFNSNTQVSSTELNRLPIIKPDEKQFDKIKTIVQEICNIKKKKPDADISVKEQELNSMVYRIYSLTYDEVKVIEPDFPLSKKEYEGIKNG